MQIRVSFEKMNVSTCCVLDDCWFIAAGKKDKCLLLTTIFFQFCFKFLLVTQMSVFNIGMGRGKGKGRDIHFVFHDVCVFCILAVNTV